MEKKEGGNKSTVWDEIFYKITLNLTGNDGGMESLYYCNILDQGSIAQASAKL